MRTNTDFKIDYSKNVAITPGFGNSYNLANVSPDVLRVEFVDFYPMDNAMENKTLEYELVRDQEQPNPALRRGNYISKQLYF